jgi:hypothetical protein
VPSRAVTSKSCRIQTVLRGVQFGRRHEPQRCVRSGLVEVRPHASILLLASSKDKNQCVLRHSSRSRPLKLSTEAFFGIGSVPQNPWVHEPLHLDSNDRHSRAAGHQFMNSRLSRKAKSVQSSAEMKEDPCA